MVTKFLEFVQGINQRSIAIIDNCSVHHIPEVAEEFWKAGVLVIFLSPYSPVYIPIELCFSYIKYYLKSHDEILQQYQIQRSSLRVPLTVSQKNNAIIGLLNVDMNTVLSLI